MVPRIDLFGNPEAFVLLLWPIIYLIWQEKFYHPRRLRIPLTVPLKKAGLQNDPTVYLRYFPHLFQWVAFLCMVIALARPQQAGEITERQIQGIDIMLLMDVSGSMETPDLAPSRLEVAKNKASEFILNREHDRIGIVLFGEEALGYSPLTLDYLFLKEMISNIRIGLIPKEGTAIGQAIGVGINRLRTKQELGEVPTSIMILLTDGANNRGEIDPHAAAKLAKQYGIRIYCIGIGSMVNLPDSVREDTISVIADEKHLSIIAGTTDGLYFHASDPAALSRILDRISLLETKELVEKVYREITDLYPFFVKLALIALTLSFLSMLSFIYNPLEQ